MEFSIARFYLRYFATAPVNMRCMKGGVSRFCSAYFYLLILGELLFISFLYSLSNSLLNKLLFILEDITSTKLLKALLEAFNPPRRSLKLSLTELYVIFSRKG